MNRSQDDPRLQQAPEIDREQAEAASMILLNRFPELPLPAPADVAQHEIANVIPIPLLTLAGQQAAQGHHIHVLMLDFDYAGFRLPGHPAAATSIVNTDDGHTRILRDQVSEISHLHTLVDLGPLLEMGIATDADGGLPETLSIPVDPTGEDPEQAHRYFNLPTARLLPILEALHNLFDRDSLDADGNLRLSRFDVGTLTELEAAGTRMDGGQSLRELARRLEDFKGIRPVPPPTGLKTDLRHYQQKGLD